MRATWIAAVFLLGVVVQSSAAFAADIGSLSAMLTDFQQNATPAQFKQLQTAIASSPSLVAQLGRLVDTGRLKRIELVPPGDKSLSGGPFAARATSDEIVMTAAFLEGQQPKRLFDVVHPGDVLPDNLVFVLGHLAAHMENPSSPAPPPSTFEAFKRLKMTEEARAYIVGWNDMVEAGLGNTTPSIPVVGDMLLNFRYRAVFLKALRNDDALLSPSGKIELNQQNLDAMGAALETTNMPDFD